MRAIVKGFVIGTLGLAWLLVPVGYVHAAPIDPTKSCDTQRYIVCGDGSCGSRKCYCNNKVLTPGDACTKKVGGKTYIFYCDGCSGKVVSLITRQPTPLQLSPTTPPTQAKPPAGGTLQKSP